MTPKQYKTSLTNNWAKIYQKAEQSTQINIDREAKVISEILHLEKKVERYAETPAFIWKTTRRVSNITQNAILLTPPKVKWTL